MCNQIKGVIKLFNKITAEYFTELDEQNADGFGLVCGVVMQSARYYRRLEEKYMFRQILDCMLSRQSKVKTILNSYVHLILYTVNVI